MFVTIEGLDGAGTTTLAERLREEYKHAIVTSEPTDRRIGRVLQDRLSTEGTDPIVDTFLFLADRRDHIEREISPALDRGLMVVCDRYADSTRAYQPAAMQEAGVFDSQWKGKIMVERGMVQWVREPDLTLYLDVPAEIAVERSSGDDSYERIDFLEKVRDNYRAIADAHDRVVTIDARDSPESVAEAALAKIDVPAPDKI